MCNLTAKIYSFCSQIPRLKMFSVIWALTKLKDFIKSKNINKIVSIQNIVYIL